MSNSHYLTLGQAAKLSQVAKSTITRAIDIAIVMPVADWQLYPGFVKLAFLSTIWALDEGEVSPHRVHILLEEFPTLGRLHSFSEILATGRKKKAQIEIVIQNTGQLRAKYPEWRALIPNFEVRRFKAVRDIDTAKYVSEAMGKATREFKDVNDAGRKVLVGQDLMSPDEIMTMKKDRQIVFIGNNRPALLGQYPYWNKEEQRERVEKSPFYDSVPSVDKFQFLRPIAGEALRMAELVFRPNLFAVLVAIAVFVLWTNPTFLTSEHYNRRDGRLKCSWWTISGTKTRTVRVISRKGSPKCGALYLFGGPDK